MFSSFRTDSVGFLAALAVRSPLSLTELAVVLEVLFVSGVILAVPLVSRVGLTASNDGSLDFGVASFFFSVSAISIPCTLKMSCVRTGLPLHGRGI